MPQSNDPVAKALAGAKATLAHANAAFPSSGASAITSKPAAAPAPKKSSSISIGEPEKGTANELKSKVDMVGKAKTALGDAIKMHKGGPVKKSGTYQLQAGEHVLTAPEAKTARKHALMMSGMKSLAKAAK